MLDSAWTFLLDPANREVLGWIGGGIVVIGGGAWTVFKFFSSKKPTVSASNGGVAAGRDVRGANININTDSGAKR